MTQTEIRSPQGTKPDFEDLSTAVYRYAVVHGSIPAVHVVAAALGVDPVAVQEAVTHLVDSRLLRAQLGAAFPLVPVDPEVAAALLVSPMEREIYQHRERIAMIRQRTDALRHDYVSTGASALDSRPVERVVGAMEVRGNLEVASEACRDDVMVLLSGKEGAEEFDDFQNVCATLIERGVTVRIVCQHRSRADLTVRNKIKNLAAAGAEVRTVSHVPRAALVFDRSLALLSGTSRDGDTSATRLVHVDVVSFLLDIFDHLWDIATPLDCFESGYAEVADDLQQTIAGLMAKGFTDEVLARKLGMSVRTCRRHIATLMRDVEAVSRFQAGVQAARRGLVASGE